jgi:hypothetical protein
VLTANEIAVLDQFMKTETGYDEKAA